MLLQAQPVTWAGAKDVAAKRQPGRSGAGAHVPAANGRAHSSGLPGSNAVQRSSSNNLAATGIS